jgi:basic amino acid/polyamine antiporter, APA family
MATDSTRTRFPAALSIVAGSMIGTGVFASLGFQADALPSGFPILLLWLVGGVLAFCGAVNYAELSAAYPRSGGEYQLLSRVYHPGVGFVSGWVSMIGGFPAPAAIAALTVGHYACGLSGRDGEDARLPAQLIAAALMTCLTGAHLVSVRFSGQSPRCSRACSSRRSQSADSCCRRHSP